MTEKGRIHRIKYPEKVWVMVRVTGEYEDLCQTPVKTFIFKEDADDELMKLLIICKFAQNARTRAGVADVVKKEYSALGYTTADEWSNWELVETPVSPYRPGVV